MFTREVEFEGLNKSVELWQEFEGDVGCVVWDAAIVLAKFLEFQTVNRDSESTKCLVRGQYVMELGAGTGCVGLSSALMGASKVTITDLPEFLSLMEKNITQNKDYLMCPVVAKELTWGNEEQIRNVGMPDVILVADCIYYEQSLEPLVSTITQLCSPRTNVILSYEERITGNKPQLQNRFFELMEENFHKEKIALEEQHEQYRCAEIHIYKFWLR